MADQLTTNALLANALGIDLADLNTSRAGVVIDACTAVVQDAARQRLVQVVGDTWETAGPPGRYLRLPERPVTAITSVTLDGTALTAGTASGTYRRSLDRIYRDVGWFTTGTDTCAPSDIIVVYSHGWPDGHQKLQLAASTTLMLAARVYEVPAGVTSERIDDYAVTYDKAAALLDGAPALLRRVRSAYALKAQMVAVVG